MARRMLALVGLLLVALGAARALAEPSMAVPASVQLALFTKIWTLDRTFPRHGTVTVAVVYQRRYRESFVTKEELMAAGPDLPNVRIIAIDIEGGTLGADQLEGVDVVYVAPLRAVALVDILAQTRARRIRTITGVPGHVLNGVAVGIEAQRDRPLIVINLQAARAEGSDFSSQLLKLARVIR